MPDDRRLPVLLAVLAGVTLVAGFVLQRVFATLFFAVTVAYVLIPVRGTFVRYGLTPRIAAGAATTLAFLAVAALLAPMGAALYLRREQLFDFLGRTPDLVRVELGGFSYSVDLGTLFGDIETAAADLALGVARELPAFSFKLFLFGLVVYALLVRPDRVGAALLRPVPREYHDIVLAFHARTRSMLYGIYVLQAAVAVATFVIGAVVFFALGYESWFTLAVLSGLLQFIPILGPSLLVIVVGAVELIAGNATQAVLVVTVGLVVVGALPDLLVRPRLAHIATDVPASLYFIGFVGGTLSVGLVGLVAGPVVVAWISEAVALLSAETAAEGRRSTVDEWLPREPHGGPGTDPGSGGGSGAGPGDPDAPPDSSPADAEGSGED